MKDKNLIKLGAWAQKRFGLPDDFEIHFKPYDPWCVDRPMIIPIFPEGDDRFSPYARVEYDKVNLRKVESPDGETAWIGYSPKTKTLFVMEVTWVGAMV